MTQTPLSPTRTPTPAAGHRSGIAEDTLLTAFVPMVWGTTYLVTTELLPPGHPFFAALMRALPAGLLALILTRALPRGVWWGRMLVLGTLNIGAFFPLLFIAAQHLPGGVAATLGAVQPIIVAVLAVAVLGEAPSRWRILWGLVGVTGVGLVVLGPEAAISFPGVLAGLLGAASMALGVVLTKRWGRPAGVSPMAYAGWQLTVGGVVLLPVTVTLEGTPPVVDLPALGGYLWLGLAGGLLAYTLWFRGISRLPVTATALLGLVSPLTAAVLGAAVLGEHFALPQAIGFALALLALLAGQLPGGMRFTSANRESRSGSRRKRHHACVIVNRWRGRPAACTIWNMPVHERSIPTDPQTLWTVISDLDRWDQMLPTIDEVTRLGSPGQITVGTRFEVRQPGLPAAQYVVSDWRPGRGFAWTTTGMGARATATHELVPERTGTRLRLGIEWTGPTSWLMRALITRRARSYLAQEADTFARLATGPKHPD